MDAIRVLIADDHPIVREGLRTLIASEPGMEIVGEATNGAEAVSLARALQPDVILMDLIMPVKDGLQAIGEIKDENPDVSILVLTSFSEEDKGTLAEGQLADLAVLDRDIFAEPPEALLEVHPTRVMVGGIWRSNKEPRAPQ